MKLTTFLGIWAHTEKVSDIAPSYIAPKSATKNHIAPGGYTREFTVPYILGTFLLCFVVCDHMVSGVVIMTSRCRQPDVLLCMTDVDNQMFRSDDQMFCCRGPDIDNQMFYFRPPNLDYQIYVSDDHEDQQDLFFGR